MPKSKNKISYSQCLDYLADIKEYCGNGIIKLSYRNKKTELACVMQISGIDIFHYSTDDIYAVCNNFAKATNALSAGDFHYCPEGHEHSFINDGDSDLVFIAVVPAQ